MNLKTTPCTHAKQITRQKYLGALEVESQETHWEIVEIHTPHGKFLIAGGACNVGLMPDYALEIEEDESTEEALQEMHADLDAIPHPSARLLAWHGSLVI